MRITDLLKPEGIKLGGSATDKMDEQIRKNIKPLLLPVSRRAQQVSATVLLSRTQRQTLSRLRVLQL